MKGNTKNNMHATKFSNYMWRMKIEKNKPYYNSRHDFNWLFLINKMLSFYLIYCNKQNIMWIKKRHIWSLNEKHMHGIFFATLACITTKVIKTYDNIYCSIFFVIQIYNFISNYWGCPFFEAIVWPSRENRSSIVRTCTPDETNAIDTSDV